MFSKILIANRGEIAVRIIRVCQEMGIRTVAVYSDADADALHTMLADESVPIGPPPPGQSYLRGDRIIETALRLGCDAIHPGYGFLSENADFAEAVQRAGLTWIGPGPAAMRTMGSKTSARAAMTAAGVPVVPGYQESQADADLLAAAHRMGFPVLVKATAGGGGKGMRIVHDPADLPAALGSARREAANAFGDDRIYLEKLVPNARHIEFQVLGDHHGNAVHLFERECSVQRRHQKIVEETPSPLLDDDLRRRMGEAAVAAVRAVGYVNAGTLEFLVDPATRQFYFLEMNTRLQVEHPITEQVVGVDLVKLQIRIAAGEPIPFRQEDLSQRRHAIECRIYAEDPANGFLPSIGKVLRAVEPVGPGVRVDAGITTGDEVTVHYDPMIAKLIALGEDRDDAIRKMDWALRHYVILGVTTNIPFLRAVINHEAFRRGEATTQFVDRYFADWRPPQADPPDLVLAAAALSELLESATLRAAPLAVGAAAPSAAAGGDPYSPWRSLVGFRVGQG
ncbi:MAG: acetyl-CoA carboxylase biotin carboxylase subunit [Caldilineales bacterium]|nr:acetyl-CoA carboxylase biotin carboxylase subunit [Caldilineales bacterium]MDW8318976.1 acetyl-CoA carboxylase biotin carboxylase subunit [Anaerolineae bacterium]